MNFVKINEIEVELKDLIRFEKHVVNYAISSLPVQFFITDQKITGFVADDLKPFEPIQIPSIKCYYKNQDIPTIYRYESTERRDEVYKKLMENIMTESIETKALLMIETLCENFDPQERDSRFALIFRLAHIGRQPSCIDSHSDWVNDFNELWEAMRNG